MPVSEWVADGRARAALGVSIPTVRFPTDQEATILTRLGQTAERISHLWGAQADDAHR